MRRCILCNGELTFPTYGRMGNLCSNSCRLIKNSLIEQDLYVLNEQKRAILYRHGLVQPTYKKEQSVSKAYMQSKYRDKMTSNWKEIADATGFNYDGTPKV